MKAVHTVRMAAPVSAPGEAEALYAAGATELYCGLQDADWTAKYGGHDCISRRQGGANLATLTELRAVREEAAALGIPVMLTVNGFYTQPQLMAVADLCARWEGMGGAGIMACDPALLLLLREQGSALLRSLSLLASVSNGPALGFYHSLGVRRAVLPRFLTPGEMGAILGAYPDVEGEALVWLDKCPFIDGFCRFLHGVGYADAPAEARTERELRTWDMSYRLPACWELCGQPPFLPACAACGMESLLENGVGIFKLGGRGRSLETRVQGVRFLRECLGLGIPERKALYRKRFGANCSPAVCYDSCLGRGGHEINPLTQAYPYATI